MFNLSPYLKALGISFLFASGAICHAAQGLDLQGVLYSCMDDAMATRDMLTEDIGQAQSAPSRIFENRVGRAIWSVGITQDTTSAIDYYLTTNMVPAEFRRWDYSSPRIIDQNQATEKWRFYSLGLTSNGNIRARTEDIPATDFIFYCEADIYKIPSSKSGVSAILYCYGNSGNARSSQVIGQMLSMLQDHRSAAYPVKEGRRVQQYWMDRLVLPGDERLSDPYNLLSCGQELIAQSAKNQIRHLL